MNLKDKVVAVMSDGRYRMLREIQSQIYARFLEMYDTTSISAALRVIDASHKYDYKKVSNLKCVGRKQYWSYRLVKIKTRTVSH